MICLVSVIHDEDTNYDKYIYIYMCTCVHVCVIFVHGL